LTLGCAASIWRRMKRFAMIVRFVTIAVAERRRAAARACA